MAEAYFLNKDFKVFFKGSQISKSKNLQEIEKEISFEASYSQLTEKEYK